MAETEKITEEELQARRALIDVLREQSQAQAKNVATEDWQTKFRHNLMQKQGMTSKQAEAATLKFASTMSSAQAELAQAVAKLVATLDSALTTQARGEESINTYNKSLTELTDTTNSLVKAVGFALSALSLFLPGGIIVKGIMQAAIGLGTFLVTKKNEIDNRLANASRDRKSTRLNSSHVSESRMPSSA